MWNSESLSPKQLNSTVATMMIALSTICFGLVPLFAKAMSNAGLASPTIVFYRYLLTALLLSPALTFAAQKRTATFWAISAGLSGGLGWIAYLEALKSAPVATVGVIYFQLPFIPRPSLLLVQLGQRLQEALDYRPCLSSGGWPLASKLLYFKA